MIEAFSLKTAHWFGDALASQARLRYRIFVKYRALPHNHCDGMEYDEFDTPATVYLVWRDQNLIVRGLVRVAPTSLPYMLESYWPFLCKTRQLPKCEDVWEITRVCVDKECEPRIRLRIMPELLCALQEFCFGNGISAIVGVTRPHLVTYFRREGMEWLGDAAEIEGQQEAAFWVPTEYLRPEPRRLTGISFPVLTLDPLAKRNAA